MDIEELKQMIKSTLVSYPLTPLQIEQISCQLAEDLRLKLNEEEREYE